eukprot:s865_g22.t1
MNVVDKEILRTQYLAGCGRLGGFVWLHCDLRCRFGEQYPGDLPEDAGQLFVEDEPRTPNQIQVMLYTAQMLVQPIFLLAMYFWSPDVLKFYTVLCQLLFVLLAALAIRSPLDLVACSLSVPLILLGDAIRHLMMPHCFHLFPLDEQIDSSLASVYGTLRAYAARSSLMTAPHSTPENSDIQILPEGFRWRG